MAGDAAILPAGSLPGAQANNYSEGYETRVQTMDEVMKALEDPAISVIALCGLGGVGKTTMVHEVRERAREQKLFDKVAMTTVTQNQDLFKIQGDLAEMLGLTSLKEEKNGRADQLVKRLTSGNKVLVILDDVWSDINLKNVGIPAGSEHTKCKVIIISRQEGVCSDIQKSITVRVLAKDEARALFRKTAGECVKMYNLEKIADEVADECGGLPIALLTLSRALSKYKDSRSWEDARARLREGNATSIPGMEQNVYQSIKLSYDHLAMQKQQEAQSLLLLCCQHQEDAEIKVEMLARYCLSLELFEGVTGVVHARNRVYRLIEQLKSCFLLQAVGAADDEDIEWRDEAVKVHDVVRDVCLSMVSRHEADRDRVYMHIMEKEIDDSDKIGTEEEIDAADKIGTSEVDHPKIKLLMMLPGAPLHPTPSRQQMEELRVLEILSREDFGPGPYLFQFPTNLRMLSLGAEFVHPHITSELSMLTDLEVLRFQGSSVHSLLCIGKLGNLKLLDLRCKFQTIICTLPSGILSGLTKLEVLYMGGYHFADKNLGILRDSTGLRGTETCISELDSLRNLTTLQIFLSNPMELLELKHFSFEKLERFHFCMEASNVIKSSSLCPLVLKTLQLKEVGIEWVFGDKIQSIIERTVDLTLEFIEDWTDPLIIERFASLRKLFIRGCHKLEYIIHDGDGIDNATHSRGGPGSSSSCSSVFKNLEILTIKDMNTVKELCHNGYLLEGSLYKLRKLQLHNLPIMRHLWVGPTNSQCLVNLTKVEIMDCMALECIFPHSAAKCLVHLQEITVENCSKLKGIMSKGGEKTATGIETNIREETNKLLIHFPMLRKVTIEASFDFRGFYNLEDGRGQPLFNPLVMLPRIEELFVWQLHQLKQITGGKMLGFPTLAAANWLQNLNQLTVCDCESLESVFDFEGVEAMTIIEDARSLLCELQMISVWMLPNLEHLCRQVPKEVHIFQNLMTLEVEYCDSLAYLIPSSIAHMLVNLKKLIVERCKGMKGVVYNMNEEDYSELEKKVVFRSLTSVKLEDLENLLSFCSSDQQVFEFPSLETVSIIECPRIETFCCQVPSVAYSRMSGGNVSKGEGTSISGGGEIKKVPLPTDLVPQFPKLKQVILEDTPKFRGFYNIDNDNGRLLPLYHPLVMLSRMADIAVDGLNMVKQIVGGRMVDIRKFVGSEWLQNLETVDVRRCNSLDSVFDFEWQQVMGENTQVVTLGKLKEMDLSSLPNLTHIFRCRMQDISVPELQGLYVQNCGSLVNIAASDLIKLLWNLKEINVESCESIKAVFDFEGLEVMREDVSSILGKLEKIVLWSLPKVEHVCRLVPKEIHVFGNLKTLKVNNCGSMTYLIPSFMVHMLVNLQVLDVQRCEGMNEVVCKMNREDCGELEKVIIVGGGEMIKEAKDHRVLKFPRLKDIYLGELTNLRGFYNVDHDDGRLRTLFNTLAMLPTMENLEVYELHQLKQIVGGRMPDIPSFGASDWQSNLQRLDVCDCDSLESVFDFEGEQIMGENVHVVTLGKLQSVMLSNLPNLTHIFRGRIVSTPELKFIHVQRCDSLVSLAESSLLQLLQNLKLVRLKNCKAITAVLDFEGYDVTREDAQAVLSKLETILLHQLPNLEHICRQVPKEVNGFQNLRTLVVDGCDSLSYLLTSTMAHMLVNLKNLFVLKCKSMKEVVKMTKDCGENKIVFLSLRCLGLVYLEKLSSFCSAMLHEFGFPSLDQLMISKCPVMKTFCCGHVTAEKLQGVYFFDNSNEDNDGDDDDDDNDDDDDFDFDYDYNDGFDFDFDFDDADGKVVWKSDVNETIRHFNKRVKQMKSDLKEDGVDDDGTDDMDKVSDHNGTTSSTCVEQSTSSKRRKALVAPDASLAPAFVSSLSPLSEHKDELAHSSSPDLVKIALPGLIETAPLVSSEHSVPTSDSPLQTKTEKKLSDASLSTSYDDWKSGRILIHGVYIKAEMKTTFEEILTANPGFLSGLRFKKAEIKTMFVESAISSLQCLHQYTVRTMSEEELTTFKESLDDLAASGLDVTWLERGYQRASLVIKEQQVGLAATELTRLERKKVEAEAAFEMARAELEEVTVQRDASKVERDALLQEVEAVKKLFGGNFDQEASLEDPLTAPLVGSSPNALPRVIKIVLSASTEQSAPSSDSPIQNFNSSVLKEVAIDDSAAVSDDGALANDGDDLNVSEVAIDEGNSSQPENASVVPLIILSSDVSVEPLVVPPVTDDNKGLAYSSSSHDLEKAAVPPHTVSSHSSTSTQQTVALALWKGHMVTHGDKDLLEAVEKHFPHTFHGVNFHNEATWEFAFNTCCRYLSKFLVASVSDLGSKEVAQLHGMLLDLEIFKFNVDWALDRLKKVEKLRFGSPFPQELADIERHRAPLLAKVEHLEAELALTKEELGNLNILSETKRKMLFDEFGSDGLDLLENSLGWDLLPSYQSGGS